MVGIMKEAQEYVPMHGRDREGYVHAKCGHYCTSNNCSCSPNSVCWQSETAARAIGAQMAKVNSVTPSGRLAGLVPALS